MNGKLFLWIVIFTFLASPARAVDTAIPFIQADDVHALGILGQKVVVAVVDTGVHYGDPDLQGKTAPRGRTYFFGQVVGGDGAADPDEDHGTVVALEIVAGGANPGVAPAAKILSIRVLHPGGGTYLDLRKGIEYVTRQKQPWLSPGIRVINLSLAGEMYDCPCDNLVTDPDLIDARNAIQRAKYAGILTVAATGNESYCQSMGAPACFSDVLPVVASYDDAQYPWFIDFGVCQDVFPQPWRVTCFSNIAYCDDVLAAPGYDIDVGGFYDWNGTSMAAPLVSGVAALRYSRYGCRAESPDLMRLVLFTQSDVAGQPLHCPDTAPMHVNAWKAVTYGNPARTEPGTGDMDCDGVVCGYDFPPFEECMTGPGGGPVMGFCLEGDFGSSPPDGDVDLRDLYSFQLTFDGAASGACCHADGTCSVVSMYDCASEEDAVYNGNDTTCADTDCVMTRYANGADSLEQGYQSSGPGKQLADDITLTGTAGGLLTHYELLVYGGGGGTFNVTAELYDACPGEGGNAIGGTQHTTQRTFNNNPDGQAVLLSADFDPPVYIPDTADYPIWMVLTFSTSQAGWFLAEESEIGYTADRFYGYYGDPPAWSCWYYYGGEPYAGFWALIECAKVTGACCLPDQSCVEGTEADCSAVSGVYQGHGTTCAQVNCSASACCLRDGTCISTTQTNCAAQGGTFHPQIACGSPGLNCAPLRYSNTASGYPWVEGATQFADDLTPIQGGGYLFHYDTKVRRPSGGSYSVTVSLHTSCGSANQIPGTVQTWNLSGSDVHTLNYNFQPVLVSGTVWMRVNFTPATNVGWVVADDAEVGSTQDRFGAYDGSTWWCYSAINGHWAGFWANLIFGAGLDDGPSEPFAWVESEIPAVAPVAVPFNVGGEEPVRMVAPEPVRYIPTGTPIFRAAGDGARSRETRSGTVTLYLDSSVGGQTVAPGTTVDWTITAEVSPSGNGGLALLSTNLNQDASNPSLFDIPPATSIGPLMAAFDRPAGISNPGPAGSAFGGTPFGTPGAKNLRQIGGCQNTFGMPGLECGLETSVTPDIGQNGPVIVASGSFPAPQAAGDYMFRLMNAVATVLEEVVPPPIPPAHWPVSAATVNWAFASFTFTVEAACIGDLNCNGSIGFDDINPFVLYQSNFAAWQAEFPGCNPLNGDINCDGTYGQGAFDDINAFVVLMGQCTDGCPCPGPIVCP